MVQELTILQEVNLRPSLSTLYYIMRLNPNFTWFNLNISCHKTLLFIFWKLWNAVLHSYNPKRCQYKLLHFLHKVDQEMQFIQELVIHSLVLQGPCGGRTRLDIHPLAITHFVMRGWMVITAAQFQRLIVSCCNPPFPTTLKWWDWKRHSLGRFHKERCKIACLW